MALRDRRTPVSTSRRLRSSSESSPPHTRTATVNRTVHFFGDHVAFDREAWHRDGG